MVQFIAWADIVERTIIPGFHGRFIHSEHMTFALWRLEAGAVLPRHSHPHEQVVHVQSGELEITLEGAPNLLRAGTVLVIPPHAVHEGIARTEVHVMDVFSPVREDYRDGGGAGILAGISDS